MQRVGSLEIDQDLDFERRQWTVQRLAWVLFLLVLIAGLAGFLGAGPVSNASASLDSLTVEYDRFARSRAPTEVTVTLSAAATSSDEVTIQIDQRYLDRAPVERVLPEPVEMAAGGDRVRFRFAIAAPGEPVAVIFTMQPTEAGMARGTIGVLDGPEISINQFVYP